MGIPLVGAPLAIDLITVPFSGLQAFIFWKEKVGLGQHLNHGEEKTPHPLDCGWSVEVMDDLDLFFFGDVFLWIRSHGIHHHLRSHGMKITMEKTSIWETIFASLFPSIEESQIQDNRRDILSQMIVGYDTSCTLTESFFKKLSKDG